jgi:hypothetical protein
MDSPQMIELPNENKPIPGEALLLSIASAKLGIALLGVLTLVLIPATLLDKKYGLEFANWYVYKSEWFIALLFLLSLNILAAVIVRIPRNLVGVAVWPIQWPSLVHSNRSLFGGSHSPIGLLE